MLALGDSRSRGVGVSAAVFDHRGQDRAAPKPRTLLRPFPIVEFPPRIAARSPGLPAMQVPHWGTSRPAARRSSGGGPGGERAGARRYARALWHGLRRQEQHRLGRDQDGTASLSDPKRLIAHAATVDSRVRHTYGPGLRVGSDGADIVYYSARDRNLRMDPGDAVIRRTERSGA